MILEHTAFDVKPAEVEGFESAFESAIQLIIDFPGCHNVKLEHCIEQDSRYLLLVEWASLEAHIRNFRGSPAHKEFRALLEPFYATKPSVEHYEGVFDQHSW